LTIGNDHQNVVRLSLTNYINGSSYQWSEGCWSRKLNRWSDLLYKGLANQSQNVHCILQGLLEMLSMVYQERMERLSYLEWLHLQTFNLSTSILPFIPKHWN
jgi:hypothetical protein